MYLQILFFITLFLCLNAKAEKSFDGYFYGVVKTRSPFFLKNTLISSSNEDILKQQKRFVGFCYPNPSTYGRLSARGDIRNFIDSYVVGEIMLDGEVYYCMRNMNEMSVQQGFLVSAKDFHSQDTKIEEASLFSYNQLVLGKKVKINTEISDRDGVRTQTYIGSISLIHRYDQRLSVVVTSSLDPDKNNTNRFEYYVFDLMDAPDSVLSKEISDRKSGPFTIYVIKGKTKYSITFPEDDFQVGETVCYKNDRNKVVSALITNVTVSGFILGNQVFVPSEKVTKMSDCENLK